MKGQFIMAMSPEEISQILEEFFDAVGSRHYVGARYVPIFGRRGESSITWDNTKPYEPLTIVLYQGNSFTSRQYVPAGVDISNTEFWAETGNYNAQVEQYRRDAMQALQTAENAQNDIDSLLPKEKFNETNTVYSYINSKFDNIINPDDFSGNDSEKIQQAINSINDKGGCIIIDRDYNITTPIVFNLSSDADNEYQAKIKRYVIGIGKNNHINISSTIGFKAVVPNAGGVYFENISFVCSRNSVITCFDITNLIRLFFNCCTFDNFLYGLVSNAIDANSVMQNINITNCYFNNVTYGIYAESGVWACQFVNTNFENGHTFITFDALTQNNTSREVLIEGCTIESNAGSALKLGGVVYGCSIINCYFEGNSLYDIETTSNTQIYILSCYFEGAENKGCVKLPNNTAGNHAAIIARNNYISKGYFVDNTSAVGQFVDIDTCRNATELNALMVPNQKGVVNINSNNKICISQSHSVEMTTTLKYTGISITIPAYSVFDLSFVACYNNSIPSSIVISDNPEVVYAHTYGCGTYAGDNSAAQACIAGVTEGEKTFYVFTKYQSAAFNNIWINGYYSRRLVQRTGV